MEGHREKVRMIKINYIAFTVFSAESCVKINGNSIIIIMLVSSLECYVRGGPTRVPRLG